MANTISRFLFVVFLVYYAWYQQAIGYIPRLSTLLLLGLVIFTVVDGIINKFDFRVLVTHEIIIWIIFIAYALISGWLIAADKELVIRAVKMMSKFLLIWLYMIYISMHDKDNRFVIIGLYIMTWFQVLSALIRPYFYYQRLSLGPGNNANDFANFLLIGLIVTIILSFKIKNKYLLLINLLFALLMIYQIILTASRQGLIGLLLIVIGSIFLIFNQYTIIKKINKHKHRQYIAFALVALGIGTSYLIFRSLAFKRLMASVFAGQFSGRDKLFYESMQVFIDHPVWGVGLDNFQVYSSIKQFSHITWTELLASTGLIGFTIYLVLFFVLGKFSWNCYDQNRTNKALRDKFLKSISFIVFFTVLILSFVTIHFYQMSSTLLIGIILSEKYANRKAI